VFLANVSMPRTTCSHCLTWPSVLPVRLIPSKYILYCCGRKFTRVLLFLCDPALKHEVRGISPLLKHKENNDDFMQSCAFCLRKICCCVPYRCHIVWVKSWTFVSHSAAWLATPKLFCLLKRPLDLRRLQWSVLDDLCIFWV